jgi:hypothetical protein
MLKRRGRLAAGSALWSCCLVTAALGLAAPGAVTGAQSPDLANLLRRAEAYVTKYVEIFASVVADEHYVQDLRYTGIRAGSPGVRRELKSELVLVAVAPPLGWRIFRDVYDVDGKPVRDRDARLLALFSGSAAGASTLAEALRIVQESARYNIGPVHRTVNVPGLPLLFLQESLRQRFEFSLDRADREMPETWVVKFAERARPTLFRGDRNVDNPSAGRLWIQADTGAIRRTEHVLSQLSATATFVTEFGPHERFGIDVPTGLVEESTGFVQGSLVPTSRLVGTATYANFRAFAVSVDVVPGEPAR